MESGDKSETITEVVQVVVEQMPVATDNNNFDISDYLKAPKRETAPFLYDIGLRTLKGAAIGLVLGFVFFKGRTTRNFCMYYGAGVGLGMSYSQVRFLYGKLMGEQPNTQHAL